VGNTRRRWRVGEMLLSLEVVLYVVQRVPVIFVGDIKVSGLQTPGRNVGNRWR